MPGAFDQVVDAPGAHALTYAPERPPLALAATSPRLEQGWVVAAVAYTWHTQLNGCRHALSHDRSR